jgi:two-component system, OmpR family, phosphate regulon response regulator PhoB
MDVADLLLIDSDEGAIAAMEPALLEAGHTVRVTRTGAGGLVGARTRRPDLVLLEALLPDISGTEVCRSLKNDDATRDAFVVFVSSKSSDVDRVVALELGADDYVAKPFSVRELILRLNVVRRRLSVPRNSEETTEARRLTCGPIDVDLDACLVRVDGRDLALALLEFRLLVYLMEGQGKVRTREQLLKHVWSYPVDSATRTIETHVKRLRAKLGNAGERIETVRSIGYRIRVES